MNREPLDIVPLWLLFLAICGFSGFALEAIHRFSKGVPRVINLICDGCLSLGFRTQRKTIQPDMVEEMAVSLGIIGNGTTPAEKPPSVGATVPSEGQKSAMDMLVEAMKRSRAAARGAE